MSFYYTWGCEPGPICDCLASAWRREMRLRSCLLNLMKCICVWKQPCSHTQGNAPIECHVTSAQCSFSSPFPIKMKGKLKQINKQNPFFGKCQESCFFLILTALRQFWGQRCKAWKKHFTIYLRSPHHIFNQTGSWNQEQSQPEVCRAQDHSCL